MGSKKGLRAYYDYETNEKGSNRSQLSWMHQMTQVQSQIDCCRYTLSHPGTSVWAPFYSCGMLWRFISPRDCSPGPLVGVIENDLCNSLKRRDRTRENKMRSPTPPNSTKVIERTFSKP